jgi:hypothetical protein
MENTAGKIRIKIYDCELEIQGSETFIETQLPKFEIFFQEFQKTATTPLVKTEKGSIKDKDLKNSNTSSNKILSDKINSEGNQDKIPTIFGEWIHKLPQNATDSQTVLYAGYYCQKQDENNTFDGSTVNKLLIDHSIKLSNPSARIKDLLDDKKIFLVEKKGRFPKFRLSRDIETEIIATLR